MRSGEPLRTRFVPLFAIAAILLVAGTLTGCVETDGAQAAPAPAVTGGIPVTPSQPVTAPATIIPEPIMTTTAPPAAPRIFGEYRWAEYRENITQTLAPNPRFQWEKVDHLERTETMYYGVPAIREKITLTLDYSESSGDSLVKTKMAGLSYQIACMKHPRINSLAGHGPRR